MSVTPVVTALVWLYFSIGVESRAHYEYPLGIIGGDSVNITEAPFMAHYRPRNLPQFCGATIIHQNFLVTAASCHYILKLQQATPYITVGTDKATSGGEEYEIARHHPHPEYIFEEFDNDIVLLQLAKPLKFSETVQAIPLAGKDLQVPEGAVFETLGFGATRIFGKFSDELLKVSVPYVNHEQCKKSYRDHLTEIMICAGTEDKDSCFGDDGGPLIYKDMLLGVLSMPGCRRPSLYTYIPALRGFIDDVIAKYS